MWIDWKKFWFNVLIDLSIQNNNFTIDSIESVLSIFPGPIICPITMIFQCFFGAITSPKVSLLYYFDVSLDQDRAYF